MKTRHPDNLEINAPREKPKGAGEKAAIESPLVASSEFAEMFASLPDAMPDELNVIAAIPRVKVPVKPARSDPARKPSVRSESDFAEHLSEPVDSRSLSQQIMAHLEQHKIAAVSQLRIEVHEGVVVVAGEVPSAYEKQLVGHFCRQLPAVVKFVDAMVVRKADRPVKRLAPARRSARRPREWNLPFRLQHAGIAMALVAVFWGGMTLFRGPGGPERLAVHPVAGELRFEGEPASGATIFLHPQDPSIPVRPRATVNSDGTFEVTTYQPGDGAPAGRYKATIEWRRPVAGRFADEEVPPNALPAAYASPQSTPVEFTIKAGENPFSLITAHN